MVCNLELQAQLVSNSFLQEIKTDVLLPKEAENNVIKLFSVQNTQIAVTRACPEWY
jgi:hypothetical protein